MNQFSMGGAWSKGFGFFSGSAAKHALVLIGMGIAMPLVLQILVTGGNMAMTNPAALGQAVNQGSLSVAEFALMILVVLGGYMLQMGSYFASWRMGLGPGETTSGAIGFGLITGAMILAMIVALVALIATIAAAAGSGAGVSVALLVCIPLLLLFAALYTAMASGFAVGMLFLLVIMAVLGSSLSRFDPALDRVGGGGAALLVLFLLLLLFFWIAVRLSCTAPIMAQRRSFNLFAGIAESWRMTGPAQWRIMSFLALVGLVLCVGFIILAVVAGVGMMAGFQPGGPPPRQFWITQLVAGLVVGIPFAFLTVLAPAGIYRELTKFAPEEDVFA